MTMQPIVSIGKNGVTDSVISEIDNLLECKELIKISVLKNSDLSAKDVAECLQEETEIKQLHMTTPFILIYL